MKKALCVLLASVMCVGLLGCGKEEETTRKKIAKKTKAEEVEDDEDPDDTEDPSSAPDVKVKDGEVRIDEAHFPDEAFREYVSSEFDMDGDGVLSSEEIEEATEVEFYGDQNGEKIYPESLDGIEYLTELEGLYLFNCKVTSLDFSKMPKLLSLRVSNLSLGTLDISTCQTLRVVSCESCELEEIIMDNPNLETLLCTYNNLETLDLRGVPNLTDLWCDQNPLTGLDLSGVPNLEDLSVKYCPIESLDLSPVPRLTQLSLHENPITSIDLSACTELVFFACSYMGITSLDLSQNTKLEVLHCDGTEISSLDTTACTELELLNVTNSKVASLDLSQNGKLAYLDADWSEVKSLDLTHCPLLVDLVKTYEKEEIGDGRVCWTGEEAQLIINGDCELILP